MARARRGVIFTDDTELQITIPINREDLPVWRRLYKEGVNTETWKLDAEQSSVIPLCRQSMCAHEFQASNAHPSSHVTLTVRSLHTVL